MPWEAGTQFILAKCEDCHLSLFSNCLMASGRSPCQLIDSGMVWVYGRILSMFELWSKPRALEILNLFYFLSWIRYELTCSVQILTAWLISEAKGYLYSLHISPLVTFWFWFNVVTWGQILDQGNREPLIAQRTEFLRTISGCVREDMWFLLWFVFFFTFFTFGLISFGSHGQNSMLPCWGFDKEL